MEDALKGIQTDSPRAFEKWESSEKIFIDIDDSSIHYKTENWNDNYNINDFFTYFETVGIYGYVVPSNGTLHYIILYNNDPLSSSGQSYEEDSELNIFAEQSRTECQVAAIEEMFKIHERMLK